MNIVVVEDHLIIREAVRTACGAATGCRIVGETGSGSAAIELILRLRPDAVLLDLGLEDLDGFAVAERVLRALPAVRILVLSGRIDDYTVQRVSKLGVHGFLDKTTNDLALVQEALRALAAGGTWFSPAFRAFKSHSQADPRACAKMLSETELRVLALIGHGMGDDEIGRALDMAPSTAQTHRSNILRKLEITGTPKLVAFAIRHGFARK